MIIIIKKTRERNLISSNSLDTSIIVAISLDTVAAISLNK